jgi:putative endonuclease
MHTKRNMLGIDGEARVANYLTRQGFTILARNYMGRQGEVDIIALKDDVLAFVEVKTRSYHYLNPEEIITPNKQKRITLTAQTFITSHEYHDKVYRFDVAFVTVMHNDITIEYIDNAFNHYER